MHSDNLDESEHILLQAQSLLKYSSESSHLLLKSMTLNNLSNLYMKMNELEKSKNCLTQVLNSDFPGPRTNLAIAYVNMSAIESALNNHEKALNQILTALSIFKESPQLSVNSAISLIIGYHNCALEYKFLGKKHELHKYLREAWELSLEQLGPDHSLTHVVFSELSGVLSEANFTHVKIKPNAEVKPLAKVEKKLEQILGNRKRTASSNAVEFQSIRFLTGDRLQPMFKTKRYMRISSRPTSRTASAAGARSLFKKDKEKLSSDEEGMEYNNNLHRIGAKISNLQEKIDLFEVRCMPLKVLAEEPEDPLSSKTSALGRWEEKKEEFMRTQEEVKNKAATSIQKAIKGWVKRVDFDRKRERVRGAAKKISAVFRGFLGKERVKYEIQMIPIIPNDEIKITNNKARMITSISNDEIKMIPIVPNDEAKMSTSISNDEIKMIPIVPDEAKMITSVYNGEIEMIPIIPEENDEDEGKGEEKDGQPDLYEKDKGKIEENEELKDENNHKNQIEGTTEVIEKVDDTVVKNNMIKDQSDKEEDEMHEEICEETKVYNIAEEVESNNGKISNEIKEDEKSNEDKLSQDKLDCKPENENELETSKVATKNKLPKTYEENVILIQALFRKKLVRKDFIKIRSSIIKIQATVRMWEVRKIYKSILDAIVFIQSFHRGNQARKTVKFTKTIV